MPKYKNEQMTLWQEKGYMEFMKYPGFQALYDKVAKSQGDERDKYLLAFLYFTGTRPGEAVLLRREDVTREGDNLVFKVSTLKRGGTDRTVRLVDIPDSFLEIKELWEWAKPQPDLIYLFNWLTLMKNPRQYIAARFGLPAYYFRHNHFSLLSLNGATKEQIMQRKGAKGELSVLPYLHLSKDAREKTAKIFTQAITS